MPRHHHHKPRVTGPVQRSRCCVAQHAKVLGNVLESIRLNIPFSAGVVDSKTRPEPFLQLDQYLAKKFEAIAGMPRPAIAEQRIRLARAALFSPLRVKDCGIDRRGEIVPVSPPRPVSIQKCHSVADAMESKTIRCLDERRG